MSDSGRRWLVAGLTVAVFVLSIVLLNHFAAPAWMIEVVKYAFIGVIIFQVQLGIAARKPREGYRKPGELRLPIYALVLGSVGVTFFGGIFAWVTFWTTEVQPWWVYLTFLVLVAGSGLLILEWTFGRHQLTESGLIHRNAWGRTTEFRWDEVERWATYPFVQMIRLRVRGRGHRWMHTALDGLPELAQKALPHLSDHVLTPLARAELESWARATGS